MEQVLDLEQEWVQGTVLETELGTVLGQFHHDI